MEFWGVEVKSGQPLEVNLGEGKVLHLSQACLGEIKKDKSNESVCLHITVEEKKLVLGTLHSERLPQQLFDLVFDKDFKLSHNWKNGSVYFYGYKADQPSDDHDDSEEFDSEEEEDALQLPIPNGKQEAKKEEKPVVPNKKDLAPKVPGKQHVKIVEPEKDTKSEGNDSDDDDSDDSDAMSEDSDDDEENEDSSDDEEEDSDEEEETPKKQQSGKKRPNESAIKTPGTDKKAKLTTPQKTEGKKGGHVATPHPSKQAAAKTPANKSNQKSPASEGAVSCKSCNRSFKTDSALQSHNQAKHK
ncbi:histone deacetylase HDT1 [Cynara cardunculus var. scolymus]|uniref:histone deacetylase HDT1 n=1 Tax=Cynara cardunculus var. scolymus TaxID=59895 RepID=UPI000D62CA1D|nr:histone deacetylase HDT1 [Cynara cardunculus var. scolymus]